MVRCDDDAMPSRADDWLRQAVRDLAHARDTLGDGVYEWAAFAAQQAAEKAVKALFRAFPCGVDVFPYTRAGIARMTEEGNTLIAAALREGRTIFTRRA